MSGFRRANSFQTDLCKEGKNTPPMFQTHISTWLKIQCKPILAPTWTASEKTQTPILAVTGKFQVSYGEWTDFSCNLSVNSLKGDHPTVTIYVSPQHSLNRPFRNDKKNLKLFCKQVLTRSGFLWAYEKAVFVAHPISNFNPSVLFLPFFQLFSFFRI